jgi:hypothetical protein
MDGWMDGKKERKKERKKGLWYVDSTETLTLQVNKGKLLDNWGRKGSTKCAVACQFIIIIIIIIAATTNNILVNLLACTSYKD